MNKREDIFVVFNYNHYAFCRLNRVEITQLINSSDLKKVDKNGNNALMHAIKNNNEGAHLNLTHKQMWSLLRGSDIKLKNAEGFTALMYVLFFKCRLSKAQWRYLLDNSDINYSGPDSTALKIALVHEAPKAYTNDLIKKTDLLHVQGEWDTYFLYLIIYEHREKIDYDLKTMVRVIVDKDHSGKEVLNNALAIMLESENLFNMLFKYVKDKAWLLNYLVNYNCIENEYLGSIFTRVNGYSLAFEYRAKTEKNLLNKKLSKLLKKTPINKI